ncbi:antitoxin [Skermania sp. ID1734]|uniref:type II toxin-antitoxin system CcdA family antitoxin n=1 Tax=Skermania sp. ID1734 TaxID=2597516 RepID=UPI00117F5072|nr:type II toxin-antitoxin system CcdA family antitoxin [Skermania sp. ID1734]TSD99342.1 antitoxin [Skermania sp. ID1734]
MARLNVYLPDDLAADARAEGLNISALTQQAIINSLARHAMSRWLEQLPDPSKRVAQADLLAALDAVRGER